MKEVYITRDSYMDSAEIWPYKVGVRKFQEVGTFPKVAYGAAWSVQPTCCLYKNGKSVSKLLTPKECRKRYGFYPRKGEAWLVRETKNYWYWTKVDIDFSN